MPQEKTCATDIGGLIPGLNTLTLKSQVNANTWTFQNRNIIVFPLP